MKLSPIALVLALSSSVANAEESWFEVELILFERHNAHTAQQPHQRPQNFSGEQRLDLITAQLDPTYMQCPEISQYQRFQLATMAQLPPMTDTVLDDAIATIASPTIPNEVAQPEVIEPVICHAPQESLLAQAYQLRLERLAALEQAEMTIQEQSPPAQDEFVEPLINAAQVNSYDPLVYQPFPIDFVHNDINYTSTAPRKAKTIEQVPTQLVAQSLPQELASTHLLPAEALEMIELAKKMRWQKALTPILHTAWRQPVYARHLAKEYRLFGGIYYAMDFAQDGSTIPDVIDDQLLADELPTIEPVSDTAISLVAATPATEPLGTIDQLTPPSPKNILVQQPSFEHNPMKALEQAVEDAAPSVELDQILAELKLEEIEEQLTTPLWQLDGAIKIYLNHFLFIESNFELRTPGHRTITLDPLALTLPMQEDQDVTDSAISDGSISLVSAPIEPMVEPASIAPEAPITTTKQVAWLNSSQLLQNRRVRSKEIHYFDHPRFGMVIQIRRFKIAEEQTQQQKQ